MLDVGCWMLDVGVWPGVSPAFYLGLAKKVRTDPAPTSGDGRIDLPGTGAARVDNFKIKDFVWPVCV